LLLRRTFLASSFLALVALGSGPARAVQSGIIVQSTTSTQNSGLLDYLLPKFTAKTGISAYVVAVGTGQALKNARNGDGDVLLVHAKASELKFVVDGWGVKRFDVMYNDFVIVGPQADPAQIAGMTDAVAALQKIAAARAKFASRGDNSGTNKKELWLWQQSQVDPGKSSRGWYRETGSGMGATLNAAVGMGAYTLSDRATWIAFKNKANFRVLTQHDPRLFNQYGVILVNPAKYPQVKAKQGQAFIDWLLSPVGQQLIGSYKVGGKQLFFPNAGK